MNRWQQIWLSVKLIAAVAACVTVAVQAFLYMMDSSDAERIHPLSILVVGLIFGFITFGLLYLLERGVRRLIAPFVTASPESQAGHQNDARLAAEQPLILPAEDSPQEKQV
ncbi:hypothetical protein PMI22_01479 [Pseudomonas sp. GM21]|jgi:glucan phosphoethanolaminetransferase (alkaline phosphatase superfamily)|uniref:hypothetical protein n=1 Tax=Pseudomonas TaxID=286 RepID=UPI0002726F66|nr:MULTISPECIES: hypothetical protein [Pseudomonas]EJM22667.1 hypothetical protein PMI22_01479 [Pseudomonas sp. GM21]MDR6925624.1 glucan phosphoethanolaminetransferase (alkaline phosphatase superfamily) [Pseudomonas sp. BE134]MDR7282222.1 glucan phosphoethanolaminetransferase (alkaline phosphatase superfamily) [Pseudomonas corrugata]